MTISIDIDSQTQERLRREAERNGFGVEAYARKLLEAALPPNPPAPSLHDLFTTWDKEDETTDPMEIANRQREWEEIKKGLDAARMSERKLFQ